MRVTVRHEGKCYVQPDQAKLFASRVNNQVPEAAALEWRIVWHLLFRDNVQLGWPFEFQPESTPDIVMCAWPVGANVMLATVHIPKALLADYSLSLFN